MEQHALWVAKYAEFPPGGPYSQEAYAIFPRYRLAENTLFNVEQIVLDGAVSDDATQDALRSAGTAAFNILFEEMKDNHLATSALTSQLSSYFALIDGLRSTALSSVEPLPFRRVLLEAESSRLWRFLQDRWSIRGAGYGWFPLSEDVRPDGALTFHEELWTLRNGNLVLREFLDAANVSRCNMLRELGPPDFELDSDLAKPFYDGSESFLFCNSEWIVYTSHESSLTLAGTITDFFRSRWSDAEELTYGGPFHTDDLKGTWKW